MDRIRIEQDRDERIRNIKADLMIDPNAVKEYTLINDCVYLKPVKNNKCCRLFIPETLVPEILKICHSHSLVGHPGVQKTCDIVSKNYFWPHCSQQTKEYVLNCETCQLSKGKVMKRAPLESYPSDLLLFQCVSMDTVGPLPTTDNGNKFILVFVDFLSRYTEIVPIKDGTSVSVAEALRHRIITRHSCPQTLLSDNALEFTSELLNKLCNFYNIKKCNIIAHKPSLNGLVERTSKKIIELLRTLITPKTTNWDWWLDDIQLTIDNTVNSATGETPHFLLYGVERRMPFSILDDTVQPRSNYTYSDYVSYRTSQAWDIIKKTRDMLKTANKAYKNRYDRVSQKPVVRIGQKAYVLRPFKEGPLYKVSKKIEGHRVIENMKLNKFKLRHIYTKKRKGRTSK